MLCKCLNHSTDLLGNLLKRHLRLPSICNCNKLNTFNSLTNSRLFVTHSKLQQSITSVRSQSSVADFSIDHPHIQRFLDRVAKNGDENGKTQLSKILDSIDEKRRELEELATMSDHASDDKELKELAALDAVSIKNTLNELISKLVEAKMNKEVDPMDKSTDIVLEVSAGVGGQEAMLFTEELFEMYKRFAGFKGWNFEVLTQARTEIGGLRQASTTISGAGVYKYLKFEAGVHRVQRVPKTEKAGRVHTSTSTIAILPAPTEIQVHLNPADLRIETKRASGAGGQHVNTTDSAVRITHIPSGISIDSQTQRCQIQNKAVALVMLRARLYDHLFQAQQYGINSTRKLQVGLRTRNEKIRTYNYPQDRVSDHRIGLTIHNIRGILEGQQELDGLLKNLQEFDKRERINSIIVGS